MPVTERRKFNLNRGAIIGSLTVDDWDYNVDYFTGVDQTANSPVTINTRTTFGDGKARISNAGGTAYAVLKATNLAADLDVDLEKVVATASRYATHIVYKEGTTIIARKVGVATPISTSTTTPETVIQAAIDDAKAAGGGHIYVAPGTYTLSGTFAGFTIDYKFINLELDDNASIVVPTGYAGAVFYFNKITTHDDAADPQLSHSTLSGGLIFEAGTPSRLWTGIRVQASRNGVYNCKFKDLYIYDCNTAIELLMDDAATTNIDASAATKAAWANSNTFEHIWITNFVQGIRFNKTVADWGVGVWRGFNANQFTRAVMQPLLPAVANSTVTHGIRDVHGVGNSFTGIDIYDLAQNSASAISINITNLATDTQIKGGIPTAQNFDDKGVRTIVQDPYQKTQIADSATVERFSSATAADAASFRGLRARGTKNAPTAVAALDTLFEITGRGHDGTAYSGDRVAILGKVNTAWTTANHSTYIEFQTTPNSALVPTAKFAIHQNGAIAMMSGQKFHVDGTNAGGDTYIFENGINVFDLVVGNVLNLRGRSTGIALKAHTGTADPSTVDISTGMFTVSKNTNNGQIGLFYNDGGTVKRSPTGLDAQSPEHGRYGGFQPGHATAGYGFTNGLLVQPSGAAVGSAGISVTDGRFSRFTTSTTINTINGLKVSNGAAVLRGTEGRVRVRFKHTSNISQRIALGLQSGASSTFLPTGSDDLLNVISGVMLIFRAGTDTTYKIMHNDGVGSAATNVIDTGVTVDTAWHTFEVKAPPGDDRFQWSLDNSAFSDVLTEIPASGTLLYASNQIETTDTVGRSLDLGWFHVTSAR